MNSGRTAQASLGERGTRERPTDEEYSTAGRAPIAMSGPAVELVPLG
jgi:hypothetical protein